METWIPCHFLCHKNPKNIYIQLSSLERALFKFIFISHHAMCSPISSCCNHFNNMLMSVKLMVIQLELNDIDYKLVFHTYSRFTSNTWYTLIFYPRVSFHIDKTNYYHFSKHEFYFYIFWNYIFFIIYYNIVMSSEIIQRV
jgi:hypothetical protein